VDFGVVQSAANVAIVSCTGSPNVSSERHEAFLGALLTACGFGTLAVTIFDFARDEYNGPATANAANVNMTMIAK
jgi:hypothetical protein